MLITKLSPFRLNLINFVPSTKKKEVEDEVTEVSIHEETPKAEMRLETKHVAEEIPKVLALKTSKKPTHMTSIMDAIFDTRSIIETNEKAPSPPREECVNRAKTIIAVRRVTKEKMCY